MRTQTVGSNFIQYRSTSSRSISDLSRAQPNYQFCGNFDSTLGSVGVGPPEQLQVGSGTSAFQPAWPFPTNVASPLAHQPQDWLGATTTAFMNQGSTPSILSHTDAQQYQWNAGNHFLPRNFGSSAEPDSFVQRSLSSNAAGDNQSTIPLYGALG